MLNPGVLLASWPTCDPCRSVEPDSANPSTRVCDKKICPAEEVALCFVRARPDEEEEYFVPVSPATTLVPSFGPIRTLWTPDIAQNRYLLLLSAPFAHYVPDHQLPPKGEVIPRVAGNPFRSPGANILVLRAGFEDIPVDRSEGTIRTAAAYELWPRGHVKKGCANNTLLPIVNSARAKIQPFSKSRGIVFSTSRTLVENYLGNFTNFSCKFISQSELAQFRTICRAVEFLLCFRYSQPPQTEQARKLGWSNFVCAVAKFERFRLRRELRCALHSNCDLSVRESHPEPIPVKDCPFPFVSGQI